MINEEIKNKLKLALHSIERITELEVNTEQKNALKMCFPLFESSLKLVDCLESLICVSNKECKIETIREVITYAKSKLT